MALRSCIAGDLKAEHFLASAYRGIGVREPNPASATAIPGPYLSITGFGKFSPGSREWRQEDISNLEGKVAGSEPRPSASCK